MITKSTLDNQGSGVMKLAPILVALFFIITACDNGLMNSNDKSSDSFTTDMLTSASKKGPANCENQVNNTEKKLLDCMTLEGVRAHQAALQEIADVNNDSRAAFTPGYDATTDYVEAVLSNAGYTVERQTINTLSYSILSSVFEQVEPKEITYTFDTDYNVMLYSPSGDVTASVTPVDLDLELNNSSTSGCEASDFTGFTSGNIALIQRGACRFTTKVNNAENAGAAGVIIFNQGNTVNRKNLFSGTLESDFIGSIPVVITTYALGEDFANLANTTGLQLRIQVEGEAKTVFADNILAELPGKNSDNIVVAGAVLDSPGNIPGINNNGSGASAVLETAVRMAKVKPQNSVRFAWWADNSTGLLGSFEYVNSLSADELQKIALYLNFDVIGSPNYVNFVYDGDNSDGVNNPPFQPPAGSDIIEDLFEDYYSGIDQPIKGINLYFRSASFYFLISGVPAGGIYSGNFEIKSSEEADIWGGTAGDQYDPCAFAACDTFDNVSLKALEYNSDAVAYSILNTAMNTNLINGTKAKGNFKPKSNQATE